MKTSIPSNWIIGLDEKKAKDFMEVLLNNTMITNRIVEILKMKLNSLDDIQTDEKNFLAPEFAHRQAYILGQKKQIKTMLKLFEFKNKE
jgi:hypothetical protein